MAKGDSREVFEGGGAVEHRILGEQRLPPGNVSSQDADDWTLKHDPKAVEPRALWFPPFRLDLAGQQLWRDGESIFLKPKALAVLRYLLEHPQRLVTKSELLAKIWRGVHVSDTVLKTQLSDIRLALGDCASTPRFIQTAHGLGYRFIGTVRKCGVAPSLEEAASSKGTFVGREPELLRLQAALSSAALGRRQLVFVAGPAGIGKTSLVETFCDGVVRKGRVRFARGQCVDQHGAGEAYLPLLEALARIGRTDEQRALVAVLRRYAPTWLSQLPGLLDGHGAPLQPTVGLGAAPERMLREMAEALEAFAFDEPLVLLFEDVHWADPSTLAWIAYVARRPDPTRLMLLATYRPLEVDAISHSLSAVKRELELQQRCHEIVLPSFVAADIEAYLSSRFGGSYFPPAFAELLLLRTGGSPLFLSKLLASWIESELIRPSGSDWRLAPEPEALASSTPTSIVSLIETDLNRLAHADRTLLEAASVAGLEFSVASVAAALGQELVAVEDSCLRLARLGQFLRPAGATEWPDGTVAARCEFIHELYRHTVYERIGAARRMRFHERIGERQEAAYGSHAKDIAVELALHFERGRDRRRALLYWEAAGEQALRRSANREAVDKFRSSPRASVSCEG